MTDRQAILAALALAGLLANTAARAADPAPAPIAGADVMGDKGRSGPDGWVQAPITRDTPGQDAGTHAALNAQPAPDEGKKLPPGQDPGTPAAPAASGPGQLDRPASHVP